MDWKKLFSIQTDAEEDSTIDDTATNEIADDSQCLQAETPEIASLLYDFKLWNDVYCKNKEQKQLEKLKKQKEPLPEGINENESGMFYRVKKAQMDEKTLQKYMTLLQTQYQRTIKNCVVFFTVLTVIGFIATFIMLNSR